jgi:hypothetical protein
MIVLTVEQTARMIFKDQFPDSRLRPVRLSDGRYAVNENVLNDPRHARWHSILRQGTIADASTLNFSDDTGEDSFQITIDGKLASVGWASGASPARAFPYPQRGTFDMPAQNVYRIEAQYNDDHLSYDWKNNRRRCEIGFPDDLSAANGETWWSSWATILTDKREGLLGNPGQAGPPNGTLIHQWFNGTSTTSTVSSAGTLTLANTSSQVQIITGLTTHTVKLPSTSITAGMQYTVANQSTGIVTVQSSAGNTITTLASNSALVLTALQNTPTTAAHWSTTVTAVVGRSGPFFWLGFDSNPTTGGPGCLYVSARNGGDYSYVPPAGQTSQTNHYVQPFTPATGVPTYFVVQGTFGQTGHLNVWMNGTQIVNVDCNFGFYSYPSTQQIAHIATGIYQANVTEPAVLYHANVEWGPRNLSSRIASPLTVPTPAEGWT